jgi:hypothetical protein
MATDHIVRRDVEAHHLDVALQHLVDNERLTAAQAAAVRAEFAETAAELVRPPWAAVLPEVGGYVGGAFVLAACIVLAAPRWDQWTTATQITLLAVIAVLAIGGALAVIRSAPGGWTPHRRAGLGARRRLFTVLYVLGGAAAVGAAALIGGPTLEYGYGPAPGERTAATTAAVLALVGYGLCRTAALHIAGIATVAVAGQVWMTWAVQELYGTAGFRELAAVTVLVQSTFFAAVAVGWAVASLRGLLDERQLGLVSGGVLFLASAEDLASVYDRPILNALGYLMLAVLATAGLFGYLRTRYVGVLAVGVVALAIVVPQAILDYTDGALGAAGALLLVGFSIVGASLVGVRLRRSTEPPGKPPQPAATEVIDATEKPAKGRDLPVDHPRR